MKHMTNYRRTNNSGEETEWEGREWLGTTEKNLSYTCCCG